MEMNELKALYPNCPNCGRSCPIDAVSCPRGAAFVKKMLSGEVTAEEAASSLQQGGEHGEHGHGHGAHGIHGVPHGHDHGPMGDDDSLPSLLHQCMHKLRHGEGSDPFAALTEDEKTDLQTLLKKVTKS